MLRTLVRSSHPGPTVAVSLIAGALSWGAGLAPWTIAVITIMILFNQLSVGLSNDWLDADRDIRVGRTDKPIAKGEISTTHVAVVAIACAAVSVGLSFLVGPLAALAHAVFLISGWAYNLGLKSTMASVVPYITGFGALPLVVTLSSDPPQLAAWWAITAGASLGVAAHFSNVVPDLVDDDATGVRGVPHRAGASASAIVIAISLVAAALSATLGPGEAPSIVAVIGVGATLGLAGLSIILVARRRISRLLFRLTIAAALIDVALLLFSAPQLV